MGKVKDLTGLRFGKLTAIAPIKERRRGQVVWKCQCDCGTKHLVTSYDLTFGEVKSCGCLRAKDLTGRRFGKLTAIAPTKERIANGAVVWKCRCDCGKEHRVPTSTLTSGKTKSCGCLVVKDLTGQKFGRLIAIAPTKKRSGHSVVWKCRCDCGKEKLISAGSLTTGKTVSCGCYNKEIIQKDIRSQRFGRLIAITPTKERQGGSVVWKCRCDCGRETKAGTGHLRSGHIKSCGCLNMANILSRGTFVPPDAWPHYLVRSRMEVSKVNKIIKEIKSA